MQAFGRWLDWRRRALLAALAMSALALALAASAASASAATFTVNSTADEALANPASSTCETAAHTCTLRAAVQAADNAGGASTIELPAGEYKLTIASTGAEEPANGDLDVTGTASVTIAGAGSGSTVINANYIDRAFAVTEGAGLTISGVTIEHGNPSSLSSGSQDGGAIYSDGALAITGDTVFKGNSAPVGLYGGAIYAGSGTKSSISVAGASFLRNNAEEGGAIYLKQPGTASISASAFTTNNAGGGEGGAIYGEGEGGLTVQSSSFSTNNADYGGAIDWKASARITVTNSSFTGNGAGWEDGGAISIEEGSKMEMTLTSDRFTGNSGGKGGALSLDSTESTYELSSDEFNGNIANEEGGAIWWEDGKLSAIGSSFIDNSGGQDGGAVFADSGHLLSLINTTTSENIARYGGGLYFDTETPTTLTNDTIAFNTAGSGEGGGVYLPADATAGTEGATGVLNTIIADNTGGNCGFEGPEVFVSAVDAGHNLTSDTSCFEAASDKTGVNPLLAQPEANGGSVLTDRLMAGSPAIGASAETGCPATDARGVSRPSLACDIGAYQTVAAGVSLTDSAPATIAAGTPLTYELKVTGNGPGPSTGTMLTAQLPSGGTFYGATPSQGSCTTEGSPVKVTCQLATIEPGNSATVKITATLGTPGSAVSTATAVNDQAASAGASATTTVIPVVSGVPVGANTGVAASIGRTGATLTGSLAGVSGSTSYFFQYGTTSSYGMATAVQSTSSSGGVSAAISGLTAGTTYHYRLVAAGGGGVSYGADQTFTTTAKPFVRKCVVPRLHGLSLKKAKKALRAAGCGVGKVRRRHNRKVKRGHVITASPSHGTFKAGRKIRLAVSRGPRRKHRRTKSHGHAHGALRRMP